MFRLWSSSSRILTRGMMSAASGRCARSRSVATITSSPTAHLPLSTSIAAIRWRRQTCSFCPLPCPAYRGLSVTGRILVISLGEFVGNAWRLVSGVFFAPNCGAPFCSLYRYRGQAPDISLVSGETGSQVVLRFYGRVLTYAQAQQRHSRVDGNPNQTGVPK